MKNKKFLRILAIVCVLVLCIGVFAACNKDSGKKKPGGNSNGGGGNPVGDSMNAFVNTMFSSANEIAKGISVAEGKNIALSLGATITIKKDDGDNGEMPIDLALKGFIDREKVTDKYIATENGAYVLSDNVVTGFTDKTELKEGEVRVNKDGENYVVHKEGEYVAKFVAFNSSNSAQTGYTRFSKEVKLNPDNETYIDVSARINGVDSFRLIYEEDFLYVTIAGNKVGVDLKNLEKTANGQTVKDAIVTKIDELLGKDIVKSIVGAFKGEDFNLNEVITGLINTFVKKEYMPYTKDLYNAANRKRYNKVSDTEYVKDDDGELVVKTLADKIYDKGDKLIGGFLKISALVENLFKNKDNVYKCLGETIDIQSILTMDLEGSPLASMLFEDPQWKVWDQKKGDFVNKPYTQTKTTQKLSAMIALSPLKEFIGKKMPILNGAIKLGFEKEAGKDGSTGKMSKFFIDLNLPAGTDSDGNVTKTFDIGIAITDLKIGNSKEAIKTPVNKDEYGAMNIDAGLDFNFGNDLLSLVAHDSTSPDGITFKVGGKDLKYEYDAATKKSTLTVPEKLEFNIQGTLDFVKIQNTRAVATITANGQEFARLQLYSSENLGTPENPDYDLQLDVKIAEKYKDVLPGILDMCVELGKNHAIGIQGFKKVNGKWGFYAADDTDKVGGVLYSVYEVRPDGNYKRGAYVAAEEGYAGTKFVKNTDGSYAVDDANGTFKFVADETAETYFPILAEEVYHDAKYTKYNVSYSYAKVNESINHLVTSGEAHVKGLNFGKLVNYLINKNDNGLFVNYKEDKAKAAAENDITISDVIMNLLLNSNKGIISAVYGLIGIDKANDLNANDLDNALVIGGNNLLKTTFDNLFEYTTDRKIDAVSMVALAMQYFTKYQVKMEGKSYVLVDVYRDFETELYKLTARGFYAKGLSKQLMLLRPDGYATAGEEHFKTHKTTAEMQKYGYAVVEDVEHNKYLYPYVLYEELEAKKNDAQYLSDEGFSLVDGKLVLINTPDVLKQAIVDELNNPTDGTKYTESNYIDGKVGSLLRQAYRLGKTYVPYKVESESTGNQWKVHEIEAAGTSANAEIIDDIALKVIIGTKKDGDRVTHGTAKVEGKVYGKTFTIKGYVDFLTEAPEITIKNDLITEDTKKNKAFKIEIRNPQEKGV